MISLCLRRLIAPVLIASCLPGIAQAQTDLSSFEQLQRVLNADDLIVVVEHSGRETVGRVVDVTPLSIVVSSLRRESGPSGMVRWTSGERQIFSAADVAAIRRTDLSSSERTPLYTAPGSFQVLQNRLKPGQTAVVVDRSGREIVGTVAEFSSNSLVLRNGSVGQSFDAADVAIIKRAGPIWDGAVKGAGIGMLSMFIALSGCYGSSCEKGSFVVLGGGVGAAIGLGIDAAFGPKTVYRSAQPPRRLAVAPVVSKDRQGVAASIRF
jgi:hypothetical protein